MELNYDSTLNAVINAAEVTQEAFVSLIDTVESTCDTIANYGGHALRYIDEKTAYPQALLAKAIKTSTRPFWNLLAGGFRFPLSSLSWHTPRQIVWLEGHRELSEEHPTSQRVQQLAQDLGIEQMPKVYSKSKYAWPLSHGGWSGVFQPTLVVKSTDSDGWLKRQLIGAKSHETSIQMACIALIASSVGFLLDSATSPFASTVKLAVLIGGSLTTYIGSQVALDTYTVDQLSEDEKVELKYQLAQIQELPLFDPLAPAKARIQAIPKAMYLLPAYIRSLFI